MKEFIEKLIGRLEEKKNLFAYKCVDYAEGLADAYEQSINIVNQLAEEYKNGWIPVSERLPEEDEDVLVWYEYFRYGNFNRLYQTIGTSYTYRGEWSGFVNGSSGWRDLRIIAWQPLPEPFKERDKIE